MLSGSGTPGRRQARRICRWRKGTSSLSPVRSRMAGGKVRTLLVVQDGSPLRSSACCRPSRNLHRPPPPHRPARSLMSRLQTMCPGVISVKARRLPIRCPLFPPLRRAPRPSHSTRLAIRVYISPRRRLVSRLAQRCREPCLALYHGPWEHSPLPPRLDLQSTRRSASCLSEVLFRRCAVLHLPARHRLLVLQAQVLPL